MLQHDMISEVDDCRRHIVYRPTSRIRIINDGNQRTLYCRLAFNLFVWILGGLPWRFCQAEIVA